MTELFGCAFANVQPNSGSQANQAVFLALMQPGETFMGLDLAAGGHLTHGSPVNMSGRWFKTESRMASIRETHLIDMDEVEPARPRPSRPKIIIAGGSAYSRHWDFARFREIADSRSARSFLVDMAHFAGLVAGGVHPSPFPHAHVVTSTTHKTLRGPRGGLILTNDEALSKKLNSAIFPGLQGGPLMHVIAAKAVAFGEAFHARVQALCPGAGRGKRQGSVPTSLHAARVRRSSRAAPTIIWRSSICDPRASPARWRKPLSAGPTSPVNKNGIPFDPEKPMVTSGVRVGTPGRDLPRLRHGGSSTTVGSLMARNARRARGLGGDDGNAAAEIGGCAKRSKRPREPASPSIERIG